MAKRAATIIDVAKAVGVSPSTVSHAISGKREISIPVKERIFEKIRELDYRPSFFAQALKNSSTGLIGVVANECRNPSAAMFIDALTAELEKFSYRPVVGLTGLNHRKGEEMLRRFSTGLVDGVINLLPQIRPEEAQQLCGSVPVVCKEGCNFFYRSIKKSIYIFLINISIFKITVQAKIAAIKSCFFQHSETLIRILIIYYVFCLYTNPYHCASSLYVLQKFPTEIHFTFCPYNFFKFNTIPS